MKKEHLLIAAAALIAVTSCTKEEASVGTVSQSQGNTDVINFTTNTSRAETMDLSDLMSDASGFEVFATQADSESWLINSDYYQYSTTTGEWSWKTEEHAWPTDTDDYPITFYSVYASDLSDVTLSAATDLSTTTPLTASIAIAEPTNQIDLLATATSTSTKPSDGKLSISFDHVLSKIDFGVIIGSEKKVYLAAFELNNLEDEGDYDLKAGTWDVTSTSSDASYPLTDFTPVNGVTGDETTAISFTNTSDEYSLMLLPQTTTTWDVSSWDGTTSIVDTHIEMNYRATYDTDTTSGESYEDFIGYTYAQDHPDYDSTNSEHTKYYNKALFVKVGYPLSSTWSLGKNYTYNIKIGTEDATNGYLLDDVYYDEDGDETPFDVDLDKEIGDPLSDGNIHFNVSVGDWDSEGNTSTIK